MSSGRCKADLVLKLTRLQSSGVVAPPAPASDEPETRRLRILLELIEDDDEDVREAARQSTGADVHLLLIARTTMRALVDSADLDELVRSIMLRGCGALSAAEARSLVRRRRDRKSVVAVASAVRRGAAERACSRHPKVS